jgi:hypothetical protein
MNEYKAPSETYLKCLNEQLCVTLNSLVETNRRVSATLDSLSTNTEYAQIEVLAFITENGLEQFLSKGSKAPQAETLCAVVDHAIRNHDNWKKVSRYKSKLYRHGREVFWKPRLMIYSRLLRLDQKFGPTGYTATFRADEISDQDRRLLRSLRIKF